MNSTKSSPLILAAAIALVALGITAYHATFQAPFLFDDISAVLGNASIRQLWPLGGVLQPPADATVAGRPLLNLSFAVNYALGGLNPAGYHAFNLGVHLLAALVLLGLARRTLLRPLIAPRLRAAALPVAFVIAAAWALHPVQTISVTYISQRAESLMGLFYLLTLYAFARRVDSEHAGRWDILAVASCLLGMACKEVIVTAPVMVLLYDRTFVSGSFREAWRRHGRLYAGLAACWIFSATLLVRLPGHAVGFGLGVRWYDYAITECEVVLRYLGLTIWPHPLVFDYGEQVARPGAAAVICGIILSGLLVGTVVALRRRPVLGFLGAWFFVILAPTSSVVPIVHQPMAENRLYLPLAAVVAGAVAGAFAWLGQRIFVAFGIVVVLGLCVLSQRRNADFRSEIALWRDTLVQVPANARAHYNLGHALSGARLPAAAVPEYEAALALKPDYAEAHHNLGNALSEMGRRGEAISHYEAALRLKPGYASAQYNLGSTLMELGRLPDAIAHFEAALQLEPEAAGVHYNLGSALARAGRNNEAMVQYAEAVRLSPSYPEAQMNWGNALAQGGQWTEAISHYQAALRINPRYVEALINLGNALLQQHEDNEAVKQYEAALRIEPKSAAAHYNLGNVLLVRRQFAEAKAHFEAALRVEPTLAGAQHNLALVLVQSGKAAEAIPHYEATLRLMPNSAAAHHNLAVALTQVGRMTEAMAHEEEALRLQPDFPEAREGLARLRGH